MSDGKVFGIGLSKTGTTSLYAALHMLGYRSITWGHLARMGIEDWMNGDFTTDHLAEVDAASDLPIGAFFRELDARYPGSKFILTDRPVEPWLASAAKQFRQSRANRNQFDRETMIATYGFARFNEDRFRRIHSEHREAVLRYFGDRPSDFLYLNLFSGDGWEQLCAFLGKPVPEYDFPSVKPGWRPAGPPGTTEGKVRQPKTRGKLAKLLGKR